MRRAAGIGLALFAALGSGCGGGRGEAGGEQLTIAAASSLAEAFEAYGRARGVGDRFSFGGSDELAAQIRQGARPHLYATAGPLPLRRLQEEGLVEGPVPFARNELVIAVPATSSATGLDDLADAGTDVLIGARGVPVGDYARQVLAMLGGKRRGEILANIRSEEPDVKGIVGKLVQGAADAGFVYATDVVATGGALRAMPLPRSLRPEVIYAIAIVRGSDQERAAAEFVAGLFAGPGAEALAAAGFLPHRER